MVADPVSVRRRSAASVTCKSICPTSAIIAEGVPDPEVFALLLDCVPGIAADDWQLEPSPIAAMNPRSGEILWSTLFPSEVAAAILDLDLE